ncbi:TetR/AcrR family transcriptional regulator [Jonesia denitrificans]|nr:TetR/AcrR family transcriptional regulator [Jonesia denitrificans]QXB43157.1 TetR/AcrR family transcriptional regulator [Jonesia denitrificans]
MKRTTLHTPPATHQGHRKHMDDNPTTAPTNTSHKRGSGRDRVLDAYINVLLTDGVAAATLDEVARRADISKGGLLHHFKSKDDLTQGLLDRFLTENAAEVAATLNSPDGPILGYLNGSTETGDTFPSLYMAVLRLAGTNNPLVDDALRTSQNAWLTGLQAHIDDPVTARLVHLVGDGLYLHTLLGGTRNPLDEAVIEFAHHIIRDRA